MNYWWCPNNSVGLVDNWKPGLVRRDSIHRTHEGAALLSSMIKNRKNSFHSYMFQDGDQATELKSDTLHWSFLTALPSR